MVGNNGNRLGEIRAIQKQIVAALEKGEDVSKLSQQLARVRAEIAADLDLEELKRTAENRKALKAKADAIKLTVQKQSDAIDTFLKARDTLVSQLQPLIESMRELAKLQAPSWEREPGECYLFDDIRAFAAEVQGIPQGYLPADFGCPWLEMAGGEVKANGKAAAAYSYLQSCYGILVSFKKGISTLPLKPVEGLMAIDNETETTEIELNCRVCNHEKVTEINKALQDGRSLRDLETEFDVSRSTLSRHKNNCLNLGTVRMRSD